MKQPKLRADLVFKPSNYPKPHEFDYSGEITPEDLDTMRKAMPKEALADGILISGERW